MAVSIRTRLFVHVAGTDLAALALAAIVFLSVELVVVLELSLELVFRLVSQLEYRRLMGNLSSLSIRSDKAMRNSLTDGV